ncbi:MAG: DUF3526 domain-containing protein [Parvularculaceae bacterium]|nr:DUF3526 domain-containing protein [Parvularculaceae bacterium]
MKPALIIAAGEWRFWLRSKLGVAALILGFVLITTSLVANSARVGAERASRDSLQTAAEETFRNQPDRHPHRMVHYGHYVFRAPAPLAVVDPGVDPYTGTVMFLEGHHQNSATFAPAFSGARAGALARLTPAMAYQLLVPLVLIVIGFASMAREREGGTDRQLLTAGVAPHDIWLGKVIALLGVSAALLFPLVLAASQALFAGESFVVTTTFIVGYAVYLTVWALMIAAVSTSTRQLSTSLMALMVLWLALCLMVPPVVASFARMASPMPSKIEADLEVAVALREQGDGHNANDPAFNRLRANLLEQYGVHHVEDLPINFRGVVAEAAEADLTDTMNTFAEKKLAGEVAQARVQHWLSLLSPQLAVRHFSMTLASTDLAQHHRFTREAEAARFSFVQGLNRVHAEQMTYTDDINRSRDKGAEQRTRVSAENWRVLDEFRFAPAPASDRLAGSSLFLLVLLLWAAGFAALGRARALALTEAAHA